MPRTLDELATLIANRDSITLEEAKTAVRDCAAEMEWAFMNGSLDDVEEILRQELSLEPDYLDLFIF